jgi:DNA-binding transcriptional ArsR family regulator
LAALDPDIAAVAHLFADRSRAAMLQALLDDTALPANELARRAGIGLPTASAHLAILADAGVVIAQHGASRRTFALHAPELVAEAFETLARFAPVRPHAITDGARRIAEELRRARTCYDHLAGRLGVAVAEALVARGVLGHAERDFHPTAAGRDWLVETAGISVTDLERLRRPIARACLDWSERRPHLAGALGRAIADWLFAERWLVRARNTRAVRLTDRGARALGERLGVVDDLSASR